MRVCVPSAGITGCFVGAMPSEARVFTLAAGEATPPGALAVSDDVQEHPWRVIGA